MRAESARRVVIDTNVWISAFLTKTGASTALVRQVLAQGQPVFSPATFAELNTRLWRPKFDRYLHMDERKLLLHDVDAAAHWVEIPAQIAAQGYCRDTDDDKFIHTALAASAPWLTSGDQDLLALGAVAGVRILAPADALQLPEFVTP